MATSASIPQTLPRAHEAASSDPPPPPTATPSASGVDAANLELERRLSQIVQGLPEDDTPTAEAEAVVRWAAERFGGGLVMSSSFGAQSAATLHLVTQILPDIPVVFVDTGYLFPETYRFAERLRERLQLNLVIASPRVTPARLEATHGRLWARGAEGLTEYHRLMKVEPMERALDDLGAVAWIAGLRADQGGSRAQLRHVEAQDGRWKAHPILRWTRRDVGRYMAKHDLPYHPLVEKGYASIGDTHSTRPITAGESEREGRFQGLAEECGLHVPQSLRENESLASADL